MNDLKHKYSVLLLAMIALLSGWLVKLTGVDEFNNTTPLAHSPDYFSKGYTKWAMNAQGQVNSQLSADSMIHYSDDRTTQLLSPLMFFYNAASPPWQIKAETGTLSADGNNLLLAGRVTATRAKAEGFKALSINTTNLKVNPATRYAETNEWVELLNPPNRTTGTGMKLVFAKPIHLELLANVKGNYETQ